MRFIAKLKEEYLDSELGSIYDERAEGLIQFYVVIVDTLAFAAFLLCKIRKGWGRSRRLVFAPPSFYEVLWG